MRGTHALLSESCQHRRPGLRLMWVSGIVAGLGDSGRFAVGDEYFNRVGVSLFAKFRARLRSLRTSS